MTDVTVTLRNGRVLCGPLWEFRAGEGWFTLVLDPEHYLPDRLEDILPEGRVYLRDCLSAIQHRVQVNVAKIRDVDLLIRAREEGWNEDSLTGLAVLAEARRTLGPYEPRCGGLPTPCYGRLKAEWSIQRAQSHPPLGWSLVADMVHVEITHCPWCGALLRDSTGAA